MKILTNVQALRAIAALLVICVHLGNPDGFEVRYLHVTAPLLAGFVETGRMGVDLFFIISGFIMTVTTVGRTALPSTADFFIGRVIRIYPPLWIITGLIFCLYVWHPSLVNSHSAFPPDIVASFLAFPQRGSPLLLVGWSLAYEMYFYAIFALALALGRRSFIPVLVAWAAATVAFNMAFGTSPNPWLNLISNPICCEFLLGIVVGFAAIAGKYGNPYVWLATGLVIFAAEIPFGFTTGWWRVLQATPLAIVLFGAVGLEQHARVAVPGFLTKLGDASYATYLWHVPVLAVVGLVAARAFRGGASRPAEIAVLAVGFVIVQCVALGVYTYIESPLTRTLRRAILKRGPMIAALKEA